MAALVLKLRNDALDDGIIIERWRLMTENL
jgi:hypothetical protein